MKTIVLMLLIASFSMDDVKELYALKRYQEVVSNLDKEKINSPEANTYRSFSYFYMKDYEKCIKYSRESNNSSDSIKYITADAHLALGDISSAETIYKELPQNQRTKQLYIEIQTVKEKKELFVPELIKEIGISNGVCYENSNGIIKTSENKMFLNDQLIYESPGKYVGTPFVLNDQIWFCSNSVENKEFAAEKDKSKISKDRIARLQLYKAKYNNGQLSNVEPFKYNNVEYDYISPFLDSQGNFYFSSNATGGMGGFDIYKCNLLSSGEFDAPVNIGNPINTPFDEAYYIIDGNRMYFSSSGHNGHGMLDINAIMEFKGEYSEIVNFGTKVNSGKGQFSLSKGDVSAIYLNTTSANNDQLMKLNSLEKTRQVTLSAINRFTGDTIQIHRIESVYNNGFRDTNDFNSKPEIYSVTTEIDEVFENELLIESSGYNKRAFKSEEVNNGDIYEFIPNFYGTVTDNITNEPMEGVKVYLIEFGDTVASTTTDKNGEWWVALNSDTEYDIVYEYPGYRKVTWQYPEVPVEVSSKYGMSIDTKKGNTLKIRNIYFEYAKSDLKTESYEILDNIVEFLNENPTVKIELSAHTDSRGNKTSNLNLSKQRAISTYNYLISKGIDKNRLSPVGYGESKLINQCGDGVNCSEEQHQENRRVEMKIM